MPVSPEAVERRVRDAIFGRPIIGNTMRGLFVEAMLAETIEPGGWQWVAGDWSSWDFEHKDTWATVEVKQSAARQPWSNQYAHDAKPRFDIAARTGYWYQAENETVVKWHQEKCRPADIYIFAWHKEVGAEADQRDPAQWEFHIVPTAALDDVHRTQRSIGLGAVLKIGEPAAIDTIDAVLSRVVGQIGTPRQKRP